jgi:large subunit ribosomal protein L25
MTLPEGVEKQGQANPTLVTVVPPTKEEAAAPVLTEAAAPEVITEKKPAEGAAAEGATPAKGAAPAAKAESKDKGKK